MAKKIPKTLKKSIVRALMSAPGDDPLTAAQVATRVNDDPDLPEQYRKTPKQMAFVLNRLVADLDGVDAVVLSKNGVSHHGTARHRKGYTATYDTLAEAEDEIGVVEKPKRRLTAVTVNLPADCVDYIKAWRARGVSAGRCVETLIRADMDVNGVPDQDDESSDA